MTNSKEWELKFVISSEDDSDISQKTINELMDSFIEAAESRGLLLGGGYGPYVE
jgi:hypothetical protein